MVKFSANLFSKALGLVCLKLAASALALFFHYLLARQLTAEQFGLYALAMSVLMFSAVLAKQGLEQVSVRFIAKASAADAKLWYGVIVGSALLSSIGMGLLIFWCLGLFSQALFGQPQLGDLALFIALLTPIQTLVAINSSALKGLGHAGSAMLFSGLITFSIAVVALIAMPVVSAYDALLIFILASLFALLLSFVVLTTKFEGTLWLKFDEVRSIKPRLGEISRVSRRVLVISIAALLTQQLSTILLAKHMPLAVVGSYALAIKFAMLLSYPLMAINAITAPRYARLYQAKKLIQFKTLALGVTKGLLALATVGLIVIFLSIDAVLAHFGADYADAAWLVKILAVGQWFNMSTGSVVSMLIMSGHEKLHRRNTLWLTGANVVALLVLIPLYGVLAAAIVTSVAMAIKNLVALYFVNQLIYRRVDHVGSVK